VIKQGWLEKRACSTFAGGTSAEIWRAMQCVLTEDVLAFGRAEEHGQTVRWQAESFRWKATICARLKR
jgi:hypothetical protein